MKERTKKIISTRELKILELIAKGYTSQKIGETLVIATSTVQTHRRNMLRKTGFSNSHELVGWGYRNQLLK